MHVTPTFSVIVPTHGCQALLDEALDSVMRQTLADYECIVVDDGSPDPVRAPPDSRFRLLRRAVQGGAAAARNTGLEAAAGRYVAFLDSDDMYLPRRLELSAAGHARAPVVVCWQSFAGSDTDRGLRRRLEGPVHDQILDVMTPHLGTVSVERRRCVPLDESYRACEDVEWWLRQSLGTFVTTMPEVAYLVRRHDERRDAGPAARIECSRRLLADYAEYFEAHPRARALRLYRIVVLARLEGDTRAGTSAAWESLRVRPHPRTLLALARALGAELRHRILR